METAHERPIPIGLFRRIFTSEHLPALFAGHETHEPALRMVAQLVRHTDDEEFVASIVAAALPEDYSGNTLAELPEMIRGAKAKGFDQERGTKKKTTKKI